MNRFRLQNRTHCIEFLTFQEAVLFRERNPEFARRKIREVLQLLPDKIKPGELYELT